MSRQKMSEEATSWLWNIVRNSAEDDGASARLFREIKDWRERFPGPTLKREPSDVQVDDLLSQIVVKLGQHPNEVEFGVVKDWFNKVTADMSAEESE